MVRPTRRLSLRIKLSQLVQHSDHRFLEFRHVLLRHGPDPFHVQPKIVMHENVSKGRYAPIPLVAIAVSSYRRAAECFRRELAGSAQPRLEPCEISERPLGHSQYPLRFVECTPRCSGDKNRRPSNWNGLAQYLVTNQVIQSAFRDHFYSPSQEVFQILNKAGGKPGTGDRVHIDQEIDIAVGPRLAAFATDPNTRTFRAPCFAAIRWISSRLAWMTSNMCFNFSSRAGPERGVPDRVARPLEIGPRPCRARARPPHSPPGRR